MAQAMYISILLPIAAHLRCGKSYLVRFSVSSQTRETGPPIVRASVQYRTAKGGHAFGLAGTLRLRGNAIVAGRFRSEKSLPTLGYKLGGRSQGIPGIACGQDRKVLQGGLDIGASRLHGAFDRLPAAENLLQFIPV